MKRNIFVTKADGTVSVFKPNKITTSLRRSGATPTVARSIADKVASNMVSGMTTRDIYTKAFDLLKKYNERPVAARYSLRRSIEMLGPTGFPFEVFISEILKRRGYKTKVGIIMNGDCVNHEVDVLAFKDGVQNTVECKFHNNPGYRTNVKVPLYIYARFLDIKEKMEKDGKDCSAYQQWIVTNTKFTKDAVEYGECKGLTLIGWRYPEGAGLETLIDETGLHPVTCITTLNNREKKYLLDNGVVLSCDVLGNVELLEKFGISKSRIKNIINEINDVCGGKSHHSN